MRASLTSSALVIGHWPTEFLNDPSISPPSISPPLTVSDKIKEVLPKSIADICAGYDNPDYRTQESHKLKQLKLEVRNTKIMQSIRALFAIGVSVFSVLAACLACPYLFIGAAVCLLAALIMEKPKK